MEKSQEVKRFFKQAFDTLRENVCNDGDIIDAFNKKINKSGISPTITTRPEGFKTAILLVEKEGNIMEKIKCKHVAQLEGKFEMSNTNIVKVVSSVIRY